MVRRRTSLLIVCLLVCSVVSPASAAEPTPDDRAALAAARQDFDAQRYADAVAKLRKLQERRPDWAEADRMLGHALYEANNPDEARAALTRALSRGSATPDVLARLVQIDHQQGRLATAEACLRMLLILEPEQTQWPRLLAETLIDGGRHDEAALHYRELIRHQPGDAHLWMRLGQIQLQRGSDGDAAKSLEAAHRLGARQPGLASQIGELHSRFGDAAAAIGWIQREPAFKSDPVLQLRAAQLYLQLQDDEAAQTLAAPLLQDTHPPHALAAHHIMAQAALRRGEPEAAMPHLTKMAELGHRDPALLESIGFHHFNRRRFQQAADALTQRVALSPSPDRQALHALIVALIESGRGDEAHTAMRQFLAVYPLDDKARELLRRLSL